MKQVLKKFVATKGVQGAFVLNSKHDVLESDMPSKFGGDSLQKIGRNLVALNGMARTDFSDPEEISFFFEGAALRIQEVNKDYHLIAMFSTEIKRDILDEAAHTFIDEFIKAISSPPKVALLKPLDGGRGRKTSTQSGAVSPTAGVMKSGALAGPLDSMQTILVKIVGPIAQMIFLDALEQWVMIEAPSMDSLPLLTDILAEKIGDKDLAKGFKEKLPSYCFGSSSIASKGKKVGKKKTMKAG